MSSFFELVENVAESTCASLGMDWNGLSEDMRKKFIALSFREYDAINRAVEVGWEQAIEAIEDVLTMEGLYKNRVAGLITALEILREGAEAAGDDTLMAAPDVVPDGLTDPDPYLGIEAGYRNPYDRVNEREMCGDKHETGYVCTRPQHPPTWVHFDADPDIDHRLVHAVWENNSAFLLTVRTETLEQGE